MIALREEVDADPAVQPTTPALKEEAKTVVAPVASDCAPKRELGDDIEAPIVEDKSTDAHTLDDAIIPDCRPYSLVKVVVLVCIVGLAIGIPVALLTRPMQPQQIACNFISVPNMTACLSRDVFNGRTTGSTIPSEIGLLTQLTYLSLGYNMSSTIPTEVGLLTRLVGLAFTGESLSGSVALYYNRLSGPIPSEIGRLTELTELSFSYNRLSGEIPSEIWRMTQLEDLAFYSNQLSGTIPSEIGLLNKLTGLSFSGRVHPNMRLFNNMSGTIPTEIGHLTQLMELSFAYNILSRTIPTEIGRLSQLVALSFEQNQLSGTIPSEIGYLTQLIELIFSTNKLKGTIPASLCSHVRPWTTDTGGIKCNCCSSF